jgi:hypothetical protein
MAQEQPADSGIDMFTDVNVKLRDIEEKQSIIKDRVLMIGENLIEQKSEVEREILEIKTRMIELEDSVKRIKFTLNNIIENMNNFSRKTELEILRRQFEMFEPLNLARISDVKNMIEKALKNQTNKKQQN